MILTQEQLDVLNHVVEDGQAWADHAENHFGLQLGTKHMLAKVENHKTKYDQARLAGDYKNRSARVAEIRANDPDNRDNWTPMKKWEFSMEKQERMGGIDRDTENLIADNPALSINEYTQTKYDAKIKLREERP